MSAYVLAATISAAGGRGSSRGTLLPATTPPSLPAGTVARVVDLLQRQCALDITPERLGFQ
jgi:hypothetical protein